MRSKGREIPIRFVWNGNGIGVGGPMRLEFVLGTRAVDIGDWPFFAKEGAHPTTHPAWRRMICSCHLWAGWRTKSGGVWNDLKQRWRRGL